MKLNREIGLVGGIAIVVGSVIGMGAFVLIPLICAKAGGAAWLAITIAMVFSLFSVFPIIQLSSAIPVAGAGYEYGKVMLSPFTGILFSWWSIIGGASAVALVAYGLIEAFREYLPQGLSLHIASLLLILAFYVVFLLGIKLLTMLQVILTLQMLVAILAYVLPVGFTYGANATLSLPHSDSFLMGLIIAFNICLGFQIIMELGEEIKQPERNIPLSLIIGGIIVWGLYVGIAVAYSGAVGMDKLGTRPDLVGTAVAVLPAWMLGFIRMGIVSAALTSFNGATMALPREIYTQARAGVLPAIFARLNGKGSPQYAISLFFLITILLFVIGEVLERIGLLSSLFGKDIIEFYGFLTIFGIMMLTIGVSIAAWRLPKLQPKAYAKAYIRFSPTWLRVFVVIAILSSVFLLALVSTKWLIPFIYLLVSILVLIIFRKHLKNGAAS